MKKKLSTKNSAAVELGRLGGLKGGPARMEKLTERKRRSIARSGGSVAAERRRLLEDIAEKADLLREAVNNLTPNEVDEAISDLIDSLVSLEATGWKPKSNE